MGNRIAEAIKEHGFNKHSFSEHCGVPYGTLYRICKDGAPIGNITIENFIRIAHGLGMSVEELYYGKPPERVYLDPRQVSLNGHFESFNEAGKDELSRMADRMSHDPSIRIEKDRQEDDRIQTAMGA